MSVLWHRKKYKKGMLNLRKAVLIILAVCLVFASFAFAAPKAPAKLSFWVDGDANAYPGLFEATKQWNKTHDVQVDIIPLPGGDAYTQKLLTSFAGKASPDALLLDELFVPQFAKEGVIANVDKWARGAYPINAADLYDNALQMALYNGKYYGYPENYSWNVLAYRKDSFEKAGLDPNKPPKTWNEFLEYSKKLTTGGNYGFVVQPYDWWWFAWFWENGGEIFNKNFTKCTLNSPQGVEALQFYVDLYQKHHVVPPAAVGAMPTEGSHFNAETAFINGQVAMLQVGPWFTMNYATQRPDDVKNLMYAPLPVKDGKTIHASTIGGRIVAVSNQSKNKQLAWEFSRFVVETEVKYYQDMLKNQTPEQAVAKIPLFSLLVRRSSAKLAAFQHPLLKVFVDTAPQATLRPRYTNWVKPARTINQELQAAILGLKSPKEALDNMVTIINAEMKKK